MKKLILAAILAASTMFGAGFGTSSEDKDVILNNPFTGKQQRFIIGTATETSSYYKAGTKLANYLKGAYAANTDGSQNNINLLIEGSINVAFVQGDVFSLWMNSHQAQASKFTVIATERTEHVQLIMRKGMTEDDLQKKGAKVFLGLAQSGGAGSYKNMQLLEPNYIAEPVFGELDQLAIVGLINRDYDGIIRTSHIEPGNEFTLKVLANKGLYFADIDDKELNDNVTINGETKPIYNFTTQDVSKGFFNKSAKVLETRCYIVINNELTSRKQRAEIADALAIYKESLFQ